MADVLEVAALIFLGCAVVAFIAVLVCAATPKLPPSEQYLAQWAAHHDGHDHGACTDACGCPARFWRDRIL